MLECNSNKLHREIVEKCKHSMKEWENIIEESDNWSIFIWLSKIINKLFF